MKILPALASLAAVALISSARADVHLPAIFGDHMVLQQDIKIPVWGTATPGERVTVALGSRKAVTTAGNSGKWRVDLDPVGTASEPQSLTVSGKNTLTITDVLVGDVWFASGQSNMERPLTYSHTAKADIAKASDPQLRVFTIPRTSRMELQTDMLGKWVVCSPQTAGAFTAVGYYFARELRPALNRPIGIIASYWGGTPVKAWISLEGLEKPPAFTGQIQEFQRQYDGYKKSLDSNTQSLADYQTARKTWSEAAAKAKAAGQPAPASPREPANLSSRPSTPTSLFNGMIAPFIPYAIKGVIWYQGESDAGSINSSRGYATLFSRLITDWRAHWGQADFPFIFVQLPNFNASQHKSETDAWAWLRDSQTQTLALPHTGMAITIDVGDPNDIHPHDKFDVGMRLAQVAKAVAYAQNVVPGGPLCTDGKIEGSRIRISFKDTGTGLKIGGAPWTPAGPPAIPPAELTGFTIAGADHQWLPARARIDGNTVVVWSEQVSSPLAVRYAWSDNPPASLYNNEKFPAAPFRTDAWK